MNGKAFTVDEGRLFIPEDIPKVPSIKNRYNDSFNNETTPNIDNSNKQPFLLLSSNIYIFENGCKIFIKREKKLEIF